MCTFYLGTLEDVVFSLPSRFFVRNKKNSESCIWYEVQNLSLGLQWPPEPYSLLMIQDIWLHVAEALTHCMTWLNPSIFSMTLAHYQYSVHPEIWPTPFLTTFLADTISCTVNRDRCGTLKMNEIGCLIYWTKKVYFLFSEWLIYNAVWILSWC